ncbi:DUF2306 domain-containing protein [Hyphomonas johnsonii]|uniref:DUF2306 domain-containing protein n=1 Tax=Hyphomonas johnsonii MHS-2 TaxID=1280950 RepID=A0A059FHM9_9PROT|nr:DUF2306 domain-containing protein [Hyphomonas johnsonii]KCZ90003.1 hypothetical protein HJO_13676 [Hyphomonas johnsonii MHS-2]
MTDITASRPTRPTLRAALAGRPNMVMLAAALTAYVTISAMMLDSAGNPPIHFRFDISPLLRSPLVLKAHVTGALLSFLIGVVLLLGVKGRPLHRVLGYSWVVTMAVTAITSFFLTGLNGHNFSFIHALSAWTVIVLPMGIAAARRHDIKAHRKHMTGMFVGGMLVAGLFTFLPGRMMWSIFFGT